MHEATASRKLDIAQLWTGKWRAIWVSPLYTVLLVVAAVVMVALPALYFAVVIGVGYFLKWYAVHGMELTSFARGSRSVGRGYGRVALFQFLFVYITPLLAGGSLFLFLLKPLLARPARTEPPLDIPMSEEPWLFEFVYAVCDKIGAPRPRSIVVNADVNASASFRRGLVSMFLPGDLVLTIGMPLVMGLSLRQFAGVLAHEFGHFRQRIAMRATLVIRMVAVWFATRAWERDSWDAMLDDARERAPHFLIHVVVGIAQLCVGAARLVLLGLAYIALAISATLLRQMEFSADRYEARLCGSQEWIATMKRILELTAAQATALEQAREMYMQRKELPDDLASLIAAASRRLRPMDRVEIDASMTKTTCSWLDSHPAPGARAAAVLKLNEPGILASELPAVALFMNARQISRSASHGAYRQLLGRRIVETTLVQSADLLSGHHDATRKESLAGAMLGYTPPLWRPFAPRLGEPLPPADPKLAHRVWRAAVSQMATMPSLADAAHQYAAADEQLFKCERASVMLQFRVGVPGRAIGISTPNAHGVSSARREAQDRLAQCAALLDERTELATKRVSNALKLLATPALCKRISSGETLLKRATVLVAAVGVLSENAVSLRDVRLGIEGLVELLKATEKNEARLKDLKAPIKERVQNVRRGLQTIEDALNVVRDPRDAADSMLVSAFGSRITGGSAARATDSHVINAAMTTIDRFVAEQSEYGGELIEIVLQVERDIGQLERAARAKASDQPANAGNDAFAV